LRLTEHERERLLITLAADVAELMSAGREVLRRDDVPPRPARRLDELCSCARG
jgi:urease gamma subunit